MSVSRGASPGLDADVFGIPVTAQQCPLCDRKAELDAHDADRTRFLFRCPQCRKYHEAQRSANGQWSMSHKEDGSIPPPSSP